MQTSAPVSPSANVNQNGFAPTINTNAANPNSPSNHSPSSQQGNNLPQRNWTGSSTLIYTRLMQPNQSNYCTFTIRCYRSLISCFCCSIVHFYELFLNLFRKTDVLSRLNRDAFLIIANIFPSFPVCGSKRVHFLSRMFLKEKWKEEMVCSWLFFLLWKWL